LAFLVSLIFWLRLPIAGPLKETEFIILWFLFLFGVGTYITLLAGWSSFSKFSLIGGWRSLRQAISYEVALALIVFLPFLINTSFNVSWFRDTYIWALRVLWLLIILTETQRAPFDLREGERELVSGFNTEYNGLLFTFLFLGEYGTILALSNISSLVWRGWKIDIFFWFTLWIWLRTCFARIRYDKIMNIFWKNILPILILFWLVGPRLTW